MVLIARACLGVDVCVFRGRVGWSGWAYSEYSEEKNYRQMMGQHLPLTLTDTGSAVDPVLRVQSP